MRDQRIIKTMAWLGGGSSRGGFLSLGKSGRQVVGVDCGRTAIRMVLLQPLERGQVKLLGWRKLEVSDGSGIGSANYIRCLHTGLQELCVGIRHPEIWAAVTPDRARIHQVQLPVGKSREMAQAVYWALQREEAFATEATLFDFEVEAGRAANGSAGLLQASAIGYLMPRADAQAISRAFAAAGYGLTGLVLPINALRNFFSERYFDAPEGALVFSHIGESISRICVAKAGLTVLSRGILVGTDNLAEAVRDELKPRVSIDTAQRMVLDGDAVADPALAKALLASVQPGIARMARQIERTVEYYQSSTGQYGSVEQVYFAGSLSANAAMTDALRSQLSVPLQIVDPFSCENLQQEAEPPASAAQRSAFATAFGLALSVPEVTPNFLYTHQDRERALRIAWANQAIFALFLLVVVGCGLYYAWQRTQLSEARQQRIRMESQLRAAAPLLDEAALFSRLGQLGQDLTELRGRLGALQGLAIIAELAALVPDEIRLSEVSLQLEPVDDGPATGAGAGPARWVRLAGWASGQVGDADAAVLLYARSLEQSPFFLEAQLVENRLAGGAGTYRRYFRLELALAALAGGTQP